MFHAVARRYCWMPNAMTWMVGVLALRRRLPCILASLLSAYGLWAGTSRRVHRVIPHGVVMCSGLSLSFFMRVFVQPSVLFAAATWLPTTLVSFRRRWAAALLCRGLRLGQLRFSGIEVPHSKLCRCLTVLWEVCFVGVARPVAKPHLLKSVCAISFAPTTQLREASLAARVPGLVRLAGGCLSWNATSFPVMVAR